MTTEYTTRSVTEDLVNTPAQERSEKDFQPSRKMPAKLPSFMAFFMFGFTFYLLSPAIAVEFLYNFPLIPIAAGFFPQDFFGFRYFFDLVVIVGSCLIGFRCAVAITKPASSNWDVPRNFKKSQFVIFVMLFIIFFLTILNALGSGIIFFSGYENYEISVLGPFATLIFTTVFFANYFSDRKLRFLYFGLFLIVSILMLGLGSRMFFVVGTISLILCEFSRGLSKTKRLVIYSLVPILIFLVLFIGITRSDAAFEPEMLVSIFFIEPLFTMVSTSATFESLNGRPVLPIQNDSIAALVNFIPSAMLPNKVNIINTIQGGNIISAPFGAQGILANIYVNFGIFFPFYFLLIGMFMGAIYKKALYSVFFKSIYFSILPVMAFHFYREGFITVFKLLFFNGFIIPILTVGMMNMIMRAKNYE